MDVWTMLPLSLPSLDPRGPLRSRDPPRTTSFLPLRIATRWMEHIFPVQASSIRHASVCLKAGEVDGSIILVSENSNAESKPTGSGVDSFTRSAAQQRQKTACAAEALVESTRDGLESKIST